MSIYILFILVALSKFIFIEAYGYIPETYPINWENVSSTPYDRNLNSPYLGECVCDQTWGLCDPNCCCDKDCSEPIKKSFPYCLPEQYGYPDIEYCYHANDATKIIRTNINKVTHIKHKDAFDATCVVRANHPGNLYRYFKVPSAVVDPNLSGNADWISSNPDPTYKIGEPMSLLKFSTVNGISVYRKLGTVQVPIQDKNGACSVVGKNIGFLDAVNGASCLMTGHAICQRFPVSNFANLFVAPSGAVSEPETTSTGIYVHIFNDSGAQIGLIDPYNTLYDPSLNSHEDGRFCRNAVVKAETVFVYDSNFSDKIASVNVSLYVGSVQLNKIVPMVFQSTFVASNENIPEKIIPAHPGYIAGEPVRAGTYVAIDDKSAILERKGGFAIPSGGQSCSLQNYRTVEFMHSVMNSGCTVSVSENELKELCNTGTKKIILDMLKKSNGKDDVPLINYIAQTYDALANNTPSWIPIKGLDELPDSSGTYDPVTRQCSSIMVGIKYELVVARAGVEYNPQDVIVGAFAKVIYGAWMIRNTTNLTGDGTSLQTIRFQVLFSRHNPDSRATNRRRVVPPPLLPELNDSIFYPFSD
ncbi:unnamed protein product [Phytomonas sp. EM1]|nr:unnamed protein product [Phytomonas sp. EM1]|eukprot:CCW61156.1 unnamed protein product [Phytomonas sp. isolate EM1]